MRTAWIWGILGAGFSLVLLANAFSNVEVNVAPLARVTCGGDADYLNPRAPLMNASPHVLNDSYVDPSHMLELEDATEQSIDLQFPVPVDLSRVSILGWGNQPQTSLSIRMDGEEVHQQAWAAREGVPPFLELNRQATVRELHLEFHSQERTLLTGIYCFATVPRWKAWCYFLSLNLCGPWLFAGLILLSIFGCGRIFILWSRVELEPGRQCVSGLCCVVVFAVIWVLCRRSPFVDVAFALILGGSGLWEGVHLLKQLRQNDGFCTARLQCWMLATTGLLICAVIVDSSLVAHRRIGVDHLLSLLGSEYLSHGLRPPEYLSHRPWLVHVLFSPWDHMTGRFTYWCYLGLMAGLNSLILLPVSMFARRWESLPVRHMTIFVAVMPILACYHFTGQRPVTAAFALLAIYWWTGSAPRLLWGGVAISLAFLAHPSALFVLPGALAYWLFASGPGTRPQRIAQGLAVPLLVYGGWLAFIRIWYPDIRNDLMYYPLMTSLQETFDPQLGIVEIVGQLPADHWRELLTNRLAHIRHYAWTENWMHPVIDVFRFVSLPAVLGLALTVGLLRRSVWMRDKSFLWLAIVAPLVVHHIHIGQSHPQFHISPLPFFAIAVAAAASVLPIRDRWSQLIVRLAIIEWALRSLYPAFLTWFLLQGELSHLHFFGTDTTSYVLLSLLFPLMWGWLAWIGIHEHRRSIVSACRIEDV